MKEKKEEAPQNLIVVSRPINFLYAIETCRSFPDQTFLIFIFPNHHRLEQNAIRFLKKNFEKYLPNARFQNFPSYQLAGGSLLFLFDWYLKLFFNGRHFRSLSTSGGVKGRLFYKYIKVDEVIITDEGAGSLKRFPEMLSENRLWQKPVSAFYKRFYKRLGIDDLHNGKKFSFWTMYEQLVPLDEKVRLNKFRQLKKLIDAEKVQQNEREVVILGCNPDFRGMDEQVYKRALEKVHQQYEGFDVFFKPHKDYPKVYDFNSLETEYPIEYFFLFRKAIPKYLLSFNSTSNKIMGYLFPQIIIDSIKVEADDIYSSTDV